MIKRLLVFIFILFILNAFGAKKEAETIVLGSKRGTIKISFSGQNNLKWKTLIDKDYIYPSQRFKIFIDSHYYIYIYILTVDSNNKLFSLISKYDNQLSINGEFDKLIGKEKYYFFVSIIPIEKLESLIKQIPSNNGITFNSTLEEQLKDIIKKTNDNKYQFVKKYTFIKK